MFGRRKAQQGATLVVSIGAAQVALCIVVQSRGTQAIVLSAEGALAPEKRSNPQTSAALKQLLLDKATTLLKTYSDTNAARIRRVFVVLEAPLSQASIVSARKTFPEAERVTDTLLDSLARSALADAGSKADFLSASMLRVQLNGYNTERPEGKYAMAVDLIGLTATAEAGLKDALVATLQTLLPDVRISMWSGTLALIKTVLDRGGVDADNSLALHVSVEGTELVAFHDRVPSICAFIPVGMRTIAEKAAPGKPAQATLDALRLATRGELSDTAVATDESSLMRMESELAHDFGEALSKLSAGQRLPPGALLIAPPEIADWFSRFISRIDFAPFTMTAQPFTASILRPQDTSQNGRGAPNSIALSLALSLLHHQQTHE